MVPFSQQSSSVKKPALLCIAAGASQIPVIDAINRCGYAAIGIDQSPDAAGFAGCADKIICSTHDAASILAELESEKFTSSYDIQGTVSNSSGTPQVTLAIISKVLGFPGIDPDMLDIINDKSRLMTFFNQHSVPSPKVHVCSDPDKIPSDIMIPAFVKPSLCHRSHTGMGRVDDRLSLPDAVHTALEVSINGKANVEEYLSGTDCVSIDFICNGVLHHVTMLEEITSGPPHHIGLGFIAYRDNTRWDAAIIDTLKKAINVLEIKNAYMRCGTKLCTDGTARIFEIHTGIGGDFVPELLRTACGIDVYTASIDLVLGKNPYPRKLEINPSAVRFIFEHEIGDCSLSSIIDEVPGVMDVLQDSSHASHDGGHTRSAATFICAEDDHELKLSIDNLTSRLTEE
jgi:biotin carboxylase